MNATSLPLSSHASSAPPAHSQVGAVSTTGGFAQLDDRLRSGEPGVLLVHVGSSDALSAIASHVARRARSVGAIVVNGRSRPGAPLWREVAVRLGMTSLDCAPRPCAGQIAQHANALRAVVVAPLPWIGTWDRAVAAELCSAPSSHLTVLLCDTDDIGRDLRAERFEIASSLDTTERSKWWSGIAAEADAVTSATDLASLHAWWESARRVRPSPESRARAELSSAAGTLLSVLFAAARPWPLSEIAALGADAKALDPLSHMGLVEVDRGWASVTSEGAEFAPELALQACEPLASALSAAFPHDAWARARAAELLLRAALFVRADEEHATALALVDDAAVRQEVVGRWMAEVDATPPEPQLDLCMRSAERALAIGEADEAHRWAQSAAVLAPGHAQVTLLLGRASVAMGDLVAARVALERGRAGAPDDEMAALIAVELAEVACLNGDWAEVTVEAEGALAICHGNAARCSIALRARNTLGKVLLAKSSWAEADRHFAEDALVAMAHGDRTAELRARLNRGIALMSSGSLDEARAIFESVHAEGERIGDARACAFALDNLSVVATWRHDYADALSLSERTLNLRQRLGDRLTMARILGNLAELRRKLGLFDHAEHAIAFGRRSIGPGMPPERSAHFSFVAARLALARGRTVEAQREVARALADGETAGHSMILGEAYRVATRIALEDGDLARAQASLTRADEHALTDDARAEVALLRALVARAGGHDAVSVASEALAACRAAGEEELLRETHVLLAELHRCAKRTELARAHLDQALLLRDEVAADLPSDIKAAFLARADVSALGKLQALLVSEPAADVDCDAATRRPLSGALPARGAVPRQIVGDDPAIRGLLIAIRKVAGANSTVLIRGESGTGKELVAEAIHRASDRAGGPLVTVNCAALVETLLLSELFGHEKGAFTGAVSRRRGRFELAEGGTLFLDEIGDISPKTQVALLRVLQERTFERVGGTTPVRTNARIVCATHRDIKAMVERGEFREDLYYRLRGITLEVPALRMRMGDLPRIAEHLLARIAAERGEHPKTLSADAVALLGRHRWPGNIRELENALRAASLFADGPTISAQTIVENVDDLRQAALNPAYAGTAVPSSATSAASSGSRISDRPPPSAPRSQVGPDKLDGAKCARTIGAGADSSPGVEGAEDEDPDSSETELPLPPAESGATAVAYSQVRQGSISLSEMKRQIERDCIARALAETRGNITKAAALLGMKRPRLSQLVKQYGLAVVSLED